MTRIRVMAKMVVDVTPPPGEDPAVYAERCLVAYFNAYPHDRIKASGDNWKQVKARPAGVYE